MRAVRRLGGHDGSIRDAALSAAREMGDNRASS